MKGINSINLSGTVWKVSIGKTSNGSTAMSFILFHKRTRGGDVWTRINCYDDLADIMSTKLQKGEIVVVSGSLMNRRSKMNDGQELLEIRADEIVFCNRKEIRRNGKDTRKGNGDESFNGGREESGAEPIEIDGDRG